MYILFYALTGRYYVSPAPMSTENSPIQDDEYKLPESLLRLRNGELQSRLDNKLKEIETKRKILGN